MLQRQQLFSGYAAARQKDRQPRPARRLAELRRPGGHGKSELSPAPWCLLHDDLSAVRLYQGLDDAQAKPRTAAALGAPEPGEDAGRYLGRDARTLVADRNGHARSP